MAYDLETSSTYKQHEIGSKNIYVFESHNMALPVWGEYSSRLNEALALVSFDTHADTRNPFARFMGRFGQTTNREYMTNPLIRRRLKDYHYLRTDFCFEDVWRISTCDVANDEQIQTAVDWGYLSSYTVVCGLSRECANNYQQQDLWDNLPAKYISRCDWLSEAKDVVAQHEGTQFALDFDLDFFRCVEDMNEDFWKSIDSLIKQSQVITVAKEPAYFESASCDSQFTNMVALETLLSQIKMILSD